MKYIEDVDTGELFPVEDDIEKNIDIPAFVKDDFPELKVNYSGEGGVNDIIADLSHQLIDEKNNKTVYHKFPIMKILFAIVVSVVVLVVGVFGVRFATSVNFEPITIGHSESFVQEDESEHQEESEKQEENTESEENNEDNTIFSEIISLMPIMLGVILTVIGIRFVVNFMKISIR